MIDKTLSFLLDELNTYLSLHMQSAEKVAVLSALSSMDGSLVPGLTGKLILTLVNIGKEAAAPSLGIPTKAEGGGYVRGAAPLNLNLYIMVSASFQNYLDSLRMLSGALGFFQGRPGFDAQSCANFPPNLQKLTAELVSISTQEINNLWGIHGAKYLPSAVFKLRMITLQQGWADAVVPDVLKPDTNVGRGA
ncbi:DUF4255 domain-containing protein [Trinickia dinghuensis]|uniref:DUF4255 domain-containing protein n=1 Tax=Trinickia dinghuensis TaxID=2291023 RepID=A0A3D8JY29_9BURK|nr:DUF4255 domain-containing protein [Trinickia dinghuensis]RDU97544.1 DUF4255 domain-containing protein [Trinickia dinghuensis]